MERFRLASVFFLSKLYLFPIVLLLHIYKLFISQLILPFLLAAIIQVNIVFTVKKTMRLLPISPTKLSAEQLLLHERINSGVEKHLQGFISQRAYGALISPFIPMLHFGQFGALTCYYTMAFISKLNLRVWFLFCSMHMIY
jgi:hypothetical protein